MSYADRVQETTNSTSASVIVLTGATPGFRRFVQGYTVGTTGIKLGVDDGNGKWLNGEYTLTDASTLTRTKIYSSSNGGADVTFSAGVKNVTSSVFADNLKDFAQVSQGITLADLPARTTLPPAALIPVYIAGTGDATVTYAILAALLGNTAPPTDTTAPSFPDALSSSNVTQTSFTLSWQAATDANGIARYEYSYDGSTWTTAGTALSVNLTGRTAGTTYTMRIRAIDPSGNISTVRTLVVTTATASGDTQAPVMSGSIVITDQTSSGYTMTWTAATDNVGVNRHESSIDNGATWQTHSAATVSRVVTGRPAATTDNVRVRAVDDAGNISNVLTGTATTTSGTPLTAYNITGYNGNAVFATVSEATFTVSTGGAVMYLPAGAGKQSPSAYWNISTVSGGVAPATARSGWFAEGYTPTAADFITSSQNQAGANSVNGLRAMGKGSGLAFGNDSILWLPVGYRGKMCFWIMPENGAPQLMGTTTVVA
jgi:chitodextrinase